MVLGTPGSGKTTAIVVLIQILAKLKKRVLVVSFTNSAIDNVLSRLKSAGFELTNLSDISRLYIITWPLYDSLLCLPVFISRAVTFSMPYLSLIIIVASIFPFIPYV